jgi:phage-related protein
MKPISFLGDSRDAIRDFPDSVRYRAGVELRAVQNGLEPNDWKPMKAVGSGVREIRIRDTSGAFRIIWRRWRIGSSCSMRFRRRRNGRRQDIELAAKRLKDWKAQQ